MLFFLEICLFFIYLVVYGIRALGLINYNKLLNIRKLFYSNYKVLLLGSISHTVYVIIRVVA